MTTARNTSAHLHAGKRGSDRYNGVGDSAGGHKRRLPSFNWQGESRLVADPEYRDLLVAIQDDEALESIIIPVHSPLCDSRKLPKAEEDLLTLELRGTGVNEDKRCMGGREP